MNSFLDKIKKQLEIRCGNDVTASVYDERGILFI